MQIVQYSIRKNRAGHIYNQRKIVLTKIDEHYYLVQAYSRNGDAEWLDAAQTSNFDGKKVTNGIIRSVSFGTVDKKFELLVQYEGYTYVE